MIESKLIDARQIYNALHDIGGCDAKDEWSKGWDEAINEAIRIVEASPAVCNDLRELCRQTAWERDIAMEQLEEHGIPFGGIAPDVVKVVRCKDCKYSCMYAFGDGSKGETLACLDIEDDGFVRFATSVAPDHYCSYGERRSNGNK